MKKTIKELINTKKTVLMPVAHDVFCAKIINSLGFECLAIGGFGVAASEYGLADLGYIGLTEIENMVRKVSYVIDLPILSDADTGYGNEKNVAHTVKKLENAGASAIFIEDQKWPKRCGHTNGKSLITQDEMCIKLKAAKDAKKSSDFMFFARTDAIAVEGFENAITRSKAYLKAGADGIFVEAIENLEQVNIISKEFLGVPKIYNCIEGGKTPILPLNELKNLGFSLIAYPITTLMATYFSVEKSLSYLKQNGTTNGYNELKSFAQVKNLLNLDG